MGHILRMSTIVMMGRMAEHVIGARELTQPTCVNFASLSESSFYRFAYVS